MRSILLLILLTSQISVLPLWAQKQRITVEGVVLDMAGIPLPGVSIQIEGDTNDRGSTGETGKFKMAIPADAEITFSSIGFETEKVKLRSRTRLEVILKPSQIFLPEVVISSTLKKSAKFVFVSSELEVIRNQLNLKTRYKVPKQKFHKDSRLIIYPYLINNTAHTSKAFTPIVYDGKNYDILLKRGNICGDLEEKNFFSPYAKVVDALDGNDMIVYTDSCVIDNVNDSFSTEVRIKISTFCDDEYRDTIVIANGVRYPMRFFDYNCMARDMDDRYAPKQMPIQFEKKGNINLRFKADDAQIYENVGQNAREIRKLMKELESIDKDSTKTLHVFQIVTYTSPEGTYEYNLKLAQKRTQNAAAKILKNVSENTLKKAKVSHSGVIEPWTLVYDRMMKDELPEAVELSDLMKRARNNHNEISWGVRRLKCYNPIRETYLPPLRRVEYQFQYSELRNLNTSELSDIYKKAPENLTASEFWSYISQQSGISDKQKETLYRQALDFHPGLMIAANNLSVLLIRQNRADTTLLKPFLTEDAPEEIWLNHTVALLQARDLENADLLASQLPDNENSRTVKALSAAMNGRYEEAYEVLAPLGGVNQAVLLLSMKRNSEAWEVLEKMENTSAEVEYLKAIAANRLDNVHDAYICLKRAFEMKPELKEIARKDGDVLDLLEDEIE